MKLQEMLSIADSDNKVLNFVPNDKLGVTFNSLSYSQKSAIHSLLNLTKKDVLFLVDYAHSSNGYQSQQIRIDKILYTVVISADAAGNVLYGLKKGKKWLVKEGSYTDVANQLATLMKK